MEDERTRRLDNLDRVEATVERLVGDARVAYDDMQPDLAQRALDYAIELARSNDYKGRKLGQVYLMLGLILHASKATDDYEEKTREAFAKALAHDRDVRLDFEDSVPRLEAIFDAAVRTVAEGEVCEIASPSSRFDGHVTHVPKRYVEARRPYTVRVTLSRLLQARLNSVTLFYKTTSTRSTRRILMKLTDQNTYVATIPGDQIRGKTLTFYVLVDDAEGTQIANYQSARAPRRVAIEDIATGATLDSDDDADDENSEAAPDVAVSEASAEEPEELDSDGGWSPTDWLSLSAALGTGAGRITAQSKAVLRPKTTGVTPGWAASPFHLAVSVDASLSDALRLGLALRLQIVDFTHLESLSLAYRIQQWGPQNLWVRGGIGYGHVAHRVSQGEAPDYALEGPYLYTLGTAYEYAVTESLALRGGLDFLHLIGSSPSQHLDLSVGVRFGL